MADATTPSTPPSRGRRKRLTEKVPQPTRTIIKEKKVVYRRSRGGGGYTGRYNRTAYSTDIPGGQPVLGSILQLIILFAILAAIVVAVGPLIDYFGFYVASLPAGADPYKNAVLPLFPWAYAFIILTGIVGFVYVYRTVIRQITYSRWNE